MTKGETGRMLRAPRAMLEVMLRHDTQRMMRRVRKAHGGDFIRGPLNRTAQPGPVHRPQVVRTFRHPALPQTQITTKLFNRTMIGFRQSPDPAGQKLIARRRWPER